MKVLLIIDHAPDYREAFFRELGKKVDLTVASQPCETDGLAPPDKRIGYRYIECPSIRLKGLYWQLGLGRLLCREHWDVVCCDINLRQLSRLFLFITNKRYWKKWVWRGHIFGKNAFGPLDYIRKLMLQRGAACLAYNDPIAQQVTDRYGIEAISFNNTQVSKRDFREGSFGDHSELRMLFVGRNQARKNLDRLIDLVKRHPDIYIRLIGPGMEILDIPEALKQFGRIEIYGRIVGKDLNPHFDWADLVANPGSVGLLVMNAAKHGKGILIDSNSQHGPEYWLAKEAGQPFISFEDQQGVDQFIDDLSKNRWKLHQWGRQLQDVAREKYTIEYMAEAHYKVFEKVTKSGRI